MADFDLATITAALAQNYKDEVVRTFNANSVLLRMLPKVQGEGKNVAWTFEGTGAIGENFTDGADVSNYGIDTPYAATLSWGLYRSNFKLTNLALSTAGSSRSPMGMVDSMGRSMLNASRKLASTLNVAGYSGAGTGTLIAGLGVGVDSDNTYAGIDRTSNTSFRASVIDPGALTDPSFALIRSDLSTIYDACGEQPDLAFCNSAAWNKIAGLFDETRRRVSEVSTAGGMVKLDASVSAIEIDGCVFIKDKDATANAIYYVNSNYVHWEYLPVISGSGVPADIVQGQLSEQQGALPLGMAIYPLARTGAARKITCEVQAQLVVEKPNACGVRLNVAV
jgi:hypothetical protein